MNLNLGAIPQAVGRGLQGLGGMAKQAGRAMPGMAMGMAQQMQQDYDFKQRQAMAEAAKRNEMLRAGFQPVTGQPSGATTGDGAGMLQRIAGALGAGPPQQPRFQLAAHHPSNVADREIKSRENIARWGNENNIDVIEAQHDLNMATEKQRYRYETIMRGHSDMSAERIAELNRTTDMLINRMNTLTSKGQQDVQWAQLAQQGKFGEIEAEMQARGLDLERARVQYDADSGRGFITDHNGHLFTFDRTTKEVKQISYPSQGADMSAWNTNIIDEQIQAHKINEDAWKDRGKGAEWKARMDYLIEQQMGSIRRGGGSVPRASGSSKTLAPHERESDADPTRQAARKKEYDRVLAGE